ncbi:MAG: hypothetical protein AB7Q97_02785 [Gammaproteobacteria bacterium]
MLFFHVGLQKTGTTFLQQAVFPLWRGLNYIPNDGLERLLRIDPERDYLLSREGLSGQNWASAAKRDASLKRLAELFPQARILISFRRHSGYLSSSYNHYLQHGGTLTPERYFDLAGDTGFMKREDFRFQRKIETLEACFGRPPFVFFLEELGSGLEGLLQDMRTFLPGEPPPVAAIRNRRVNRSVGYYPAKVLRWLNRHTRSELNPEGRHVLNHWRLRRWGLDPRTICQDWLAFLPSPPILDEGLLRAIDDYYAQDWAYVQAYARRRNSIADTTVDDRERRTATA